MNTLSGKARLAGITGWPVSHSPLAPAARLLAGTVWDRRRLSAVADPSDHFADTVRGLMRAGFAGVNVTIPHKVAAFEICNTVDDSARRAGAVNTLVFNDGRISGSNTDGWGFLANLRASGVDPAAGSALVLGGGGSARAVAAGLLQLGIDVTLSNRTRAHAERLADDLPGLRVIDWDRRNAALSDQALLVNTTSLGMIGQPPLAIDLDRGSAGLAVADIVYVPLDTPLLVAARARGMSAVGGLGMLLHQAVPGFRAWFGIEPVVDDDLRRFVATDLLPA